MTYSLDGAQLYIGQKFYSSAPPVHHLHRRRRPPLEFYCKLSTIITVINQVFSAAEYCVTVRGVWVKHSDCQCGSNRLRMLQLQKMTVTARQLCSVSFVALTEIHAETCKCDVSQNTV